MKNYLSSEDFEKIIISGRILSLTMDFVKSLVKEGVDANYLDKSAEEFICSHKAKPSFKNYYVEGSGNYPYSICVSINDEIVHGLPHPGKIIKDQDIVSIDIGVSYEGLFTDMAITIPVGGVSDRTKSLISTTKKCLDSSIKVAKEGNYIGDISETVQNIAEKNDFAVIKDLFGHGVGKNAHIWPSIPNFGKKGTGPKLYNGMALAIEPMIVAGSNRIEIKPDDWTVISSDHSLSAHFEHTIVIKDGAPLIVTNH